MTTAIDLTKPKFIPVTTVRIMYHSRHVADDIHFIHEPFGTVVEFFKQDSVNSIVNVIDGYAIITHEIRDEHGFNITRKTRIERLIA